MYSLKPGMSLRTAHSKLSQQCEAAQKLMDKPPPTSESDFQKFEREFERFDTKNKLVLAEILSDTLAAQSEYKERTSQRLGYAADFHEQWKEVSRQIAEAKSFFESVCERLNSSSRYNDLLQLCDQAIQKNPNNRNETQGSSEVFRIARALADLCEKVPGDVPHIKDRASFQLLKQELHELGKKDSISPYPTELFVKLRGVVFGFAEPASSSNQSNTEQLDRIEAKIDSHSPLLKEILERAAAIGDAIEEVVKELSSEHSDLAEMMYNAKLETKLNDNEARELLSAMHDTLNALYERDKQRFAKYKKLADYSQKDDIKYQSRLKVMVSVIPGLVHYEYDFDLADRSVTQFLQRLLPKHQELIARLLTVFN